MKGKYGSSIAKKGAAVVEFAVVIPLFILLGIGLLDLSIAMLLKHQTNAAVQAVGMYAMGIGASAITPANAQAVANAAVPKPVSMSQITVSITTVTSCIPPIPPAFTTTPTCSPATYAPSYTPQPGRYALITGTSSLKLNLSFGWGTLGRVNIISYNVVRLK